VVVDFLVDPKSSYNDGKVEKYLREMEEERKRDDESQEKQERRQGKRKIEGKGGEEADDENDREEQEAAAKKEEEKKKAEAKKEVKEPIDLPDGTISFSDLGDYKDKKKSDEARRASFYTDNEGKCEMKPLRQKADS